MISNDQRLLDEYRTRITNGIQRIAKNTPSPKTPEGELYFIRMLEIIAYLNREGCTISKTF